MSPLEDVPSPEDPNMSSIMALSRFKQILSEHQAMTIVIAKMIDLFVGDSRTRRNKIDVMYERATEAKELASGLLEAKSWLRAIALQYPETKKTVNEALADLKQYEKQ